MTDAWLHFSVCTLYSSRISHLHRELNSPKLYRFQYSLCTPAEIPDRYIFPPVLSYICAFMRVALDTRAVITSNARSADFEIVLTVTVTTSRVERAIRKIGGPRDRSGPCVLSGTLIAAHPLIAHICADMRMWGCVCCTCAHPNNPRIIEGRG